MHDQRDGISANLTNFFDRAALGFGGGFSREYDYTSRYVNTNGSLDFNNKLTTVNFSGSWAFDIIEPTGLLPSRMALIIDTAKIAAKPAELFVGGHPNYK